MDLDERLSGIEDSVFGVGVNLHRLARRLTWVILGAGAMIGLGLATRPILDYMHWYLELAN